MTDVAPTRRYAVLQSSVFGVLPDQAIRHLADTVRESRLLAGHILYDPEVTVVAAGLVRAFIGNGAGRQLTVAYIRPGRSIALAHLAGRHYPTAFQALEDSVLLKIGNPRAAELQRAHPSLGWATAKEFGILLDKLEAELGRLAFGSLRERLAAHLLALTETHASDRYPVHLAQLAAAVASSREVVHRCLRPLAHDGSLAMGADGVVVTNRERLRDYAKID